MWPTKVGYLRWSRANHICPQSLLPSWSQWGINVLLKDAAEQSGCLSAKEDMTLLFHPNWGFRSCNVNSIIWWWKWHMLWKEIQKCVESLVGVSIQGHSGSIFPIHQIVSDFLANNYLCKYPVDTEHSLNSLGVIYLSPGKCRFNIYYAFQIWY